MSNTNTGPQAPTPTSPEVPEEPQALVRAAISEVKEHWAATHTSAETVRDRQRDFLGATYEHARLISADPAAMKSLRASLSVRVAGLGKRPLNRLNKVGAPELMLAAAMGLGAAHRSLRSKYKRVLEAAARAGVPANRESFHNWLRQEGGIVKVIGKDPLLNHPADAASTRSGTAPGSARSPERKEAMAALRHTLQATTVKGMAPIPMIDNAPPANTFVAVIYRADAGSLVPCFCSDLPADVTALLRSVVRREQSENTSPLTASNDGTCPPQHNPSLKEAA